MPRFHRAVQPLHPGFLPKLALRIIIGNNWKGKRVVEEKKETVVKAIGQKANGIIVAEKEGGLVLAETAEAIYLRYAFVTLGPEEHILPAFLLDDWGKEIKGLGLYDWVAENGLYFPRAEIFGFKASGQKYQIFLRDLDLVLKLRCYAYAAADTPIGDGVLIETVFLPDESVTEPTVGKRPLNTPKLLGRSAVKWVRVPPSLAALL